MRVYIGNNCEKCLANQYRPSDRDQSSLDPCVPCNCSGPGIQAHPLNGECVMNAELAATLPGNMVCTWIPHYWSG